MNANLLRRAARLLNDLSLGHGDEGRDVANALLIEAAAVPSVESVMLTVTRYSRRTVHVEARLREASYWLNYEIADAESQSSVVQTFPTSAPIPNGGQLVFRFGAADVALLDYVRASLVNFTEVESPTLDAVLDLRDRVKDAVYRGTR